MYQLEIASMKNRLIDRNFQGLQMLLQMYNNCHF